MCTQSFRVKKVGDLGMRINEENSVIPAVSETFLKLVPEQFYFHVLHVSFKYFVSYVLKCNYLVGVGL